MEKFLLSFITLILINRKLGYMSRLNGISIVLIAALLCSFLPMNFMVFIAAVFIFAAFVCVFHGMCDCCAGTVSCDVSAVFQVFVQGYGSGAIDTDLLFHEHSVCDASGGRADGYSLSFGGVCGLRRGCLQRSAVYF